MKVCILGISDNQLDEGMKNFGKNLFSSLQDTSIDTQLFDIGDVFSTQEFNQLRLFNPDVVHLIPGPTLKGLLIMRLLGRVLDAKTVVSAMHPHLRFHDERLLRHLEPDLVLVQSSDTAQFFENVGFDTAWLPSGVDLEKFHPVSESRKKELREELSLPPDERLFLHVGHLKRERNVLELDSLSNLGTIVVIGSTSTDQQPEVIRTLRNQGHFVETEYIHQIQRYYQTADYYVFPTKETEHSIQIPLSVLEAMACDVPVLSTLFGGLPDLFTEEDGLVFFENLENMTEDTIPDSLQTRNRDRVREHSWHRIAERAVGYYQQVVE